MVEGTFQLIRHNGYEAFSARNLAAFLGCSTQPIMYQFPNLAELKELAYQKADSFHSEYILSGENLLEIASNEEGLTLEEAMSYFEPLYAAVHGYASLIANNGMDYDPATIRRSLVSLAEAIIGKDE